MNHEERTQLKRYLLAAVILIGGAMLCNALTGCVTQPDSYVPKPITVHYNTTTLRTSVEFGR
jgi:hypothetical protein